MSQITSRSLCVGIDRSITYRNDEISAPKANEVLIQIKAFGVNRADLLQRAGHYPAPAGAPHDVLGLEFAGEVREACGRWHVGDRVMGICAGGAYCEYFYAHEGCLLPVPDHWTWAQAATFSEVYFTAFDALKQADLKAGERLLVHAIGSGVGGVVAQLGTWMGAEVVGSTRSAWKKERALNDLPVKEVALLSEGDFSPLGDEGFDVVIDFVGAAYLAQNVKVLRSQGRLILVGLLGGVRGTLPLGLVLANRLTIQGTVLRSRSLAEKLTLTRDIERLIIPAIKNGSLVAPYVDQCFDATPEGVEAAHMRLQNGDVWSKLACQW